MYKLNIYIQPITMKTYRLKILVKMSTFAVLMFDLRYANV